jgi:crotonobetainyl-CoA:carnitine CoA-transferase CaiB-like acyl-CoA transferase
MQVSERIFDGLKVIDCASFIAGPAAATVMSDFGADVVKIEPPGMGDPYRRRAVPLPERPLNPGFFFDSRNKRKAWRSTCVPKRGAACFIAWSKPPTCSSPNYPRPARTRLGITYDDLKHLNERLIYASFTAYGETGPAADKPGFDATAWWARTALMDLVRAGEEVNPARSLPGMGDHPSALGTYGAIITALYQREKTRQGQLCRLVVARQWTVGERLLGPGRALRRQGSSTPRQEALGALRVHYQCRDRRWLLLSIHPDEWRWEKFARRPEMRRRSQVQAISQSRALRRRIGGRSP